MAGNFATPFDDMSVSEQIEHVQELWDRIAARQADVPVPQWHRDEVRRRLERIDRGDAEFKQAAQVFAELRAKYS